MQHIKFSIQGPVGHETAPLQVIGAVNDIIQTYEQFRGEVTAVSWQAPVVTLRTSSSAAQAIFFQSQEEILTKANTALKERYGGPVIERFILRPATEQ